MNIFLIFKKYLFIFIKVKILNRIKWSEIAMDENYSFLNQFVRKNSVLSSKTYFDIKLIKDQVIF